VLERGGEAAGVGQFLLYNTLPIPGALMYCSKGPWLPWEDEGAVRAFFAAAAAVAGCSGAHTLEIEPEVHEDNSGANSRGKMIDLKPGSRSARRNLLRLGC